jgi:hypothetical protein
VAGYCERWTWQEEDGSLSRDRTVLIRNGPGGSCNRLIGYDGRDQVWALNTPFGAEVSEVGGYGSTMVLALNGEALLGIDSADGSTVWSDSCRGAGLSYSGYWFAKANADRQSYGTGADGRAPRFRGTGGQYVGIYCSFSEAPSVYRYHDGYDGRVLQRGNY